ncbi:hypothetical protein BV327_02988 [Pseudomonas syringae pv. actinidiae]|nr:hypothetical protein BV327_02988 [Pseudomonas syringae pv. actinidiae]
MGGKRRLADRLIPLFPPHECYVEVFAGGASLYFMRPQGAPVEVLNDVNGDLVTLYRLVQNHLEEFVRQFKWALRQHVLARAMNLESDIPVFGSFCSLPFKNVHKGEIYSNSTDKRKYLKSRHKCKDELNADS